MDIIQNYGNADNGIRVKVARKKSPFYWNKPVYNFWYKKWFIRKWKQMWDIEYA